MKPEDKWIAMALSGIQGVGPVTLRRQLRAGVILSELPELSERELREQGWGKLSPKIAKSLRAFDANAYQQKLRQLGICYLDESDGRFPPGVARLRDVPLGLYWKGPSSFTSWLPGIAIVGTRLPTGYGRSQTKRFAEAFAARGYQVISGLALGVDAEAHSTALQEGGFTSAVLGNGLDRIYPRENRNLFLDIAQSGGLWSEFPLGRRADRQSFPQRNRLVAAMAEAVLVMESGSHGGSLITARFAAELGKSVYVVPGRVDSPSSAGCHALIRDGAILVTSPEEVMEELSQIPIPLRESWAGLESLNKENAPPKAGAELYEFLRGNGPLLIDQLSEELNQSVPNLLQDLALLEMDGWVSRDFNGQYEAC